MDILLIGATGAIGHSLVPMLTAAGHRVYGTTRAQRRADEVRRLGAEPVVLDLLDADQTRDAVDRIAPDAAIHQATALTAMSGSPRRLDRDFAATNLLRTVGTRNLLATGVPRVLVQSFTGWPNEPVGGPVKTEEDPLLRRPPAAAAETLGAIRECEEMSVDAGALVLRYGLFYGPGTSLAPGGETAELIRRRRFPMLGAGTGVWSFTHIEDAAAATVAALTNGAAGLYNVTDDDPAPVSEVLPYLASVLGVRPPLRLPVFLGRLAAGDMGVHLLIHARGSGNAKAKRELHWQPKYASWRDGFREVFAR